MAVYIPAGRRRRRLLAWCSAAALVGGLVGGAAGRATAPTIGEQVRTSQARARALSAGLRVVALHEEAQSTSLAAPGDGGADLAVRRAEEGLKMEFRSAPWIPVAAQKRLLDGVNALRTGGGNASRSRYAQNVEQVASAIEAAFGISAPPS